MEVHLTYLPSHTARFCSVPFSDLVCTLCSCADGKGGEAAHWFDRLGFACPFGTNIADWILDLASGEVAGKHP